MWPDSVKPIWIDSPLNTYCPRLSTSTYWRTRAGERGRLWVLMSAKRCWASSGVTVAFTTAPGLLMHNSEMSATVKRGAIVAFCRNAFTRLLRVIVETDWSIMRTEPAVSVVDVFATSGVNMLISSSFVRNAFAFVDVKYKHVFESLTTPYQKKSAWGGNFLLLL